MRRRALALFILFAALLAAFAPSAFAVTPDDWDEANPGALVEEHLYAQTAVLIDAETGDVLFDKDASVRMYPASTTKIMTVLLALESDIGLDEQITIPDIAANVPSDSSVVPVTPGEVMPFRDLLYGTMLHSGNDGANAIAVLVGGSIEAFVESMNQRAAQIGCTNTHFANAHGYHDEAHYSTAHDLALIAQTAMQNEDFRQIVSTASYTMSPTENRGAYDIVTGAEMVNPNSGYYYEGCIGIKTGFHSQAGQCFVGALEKDGITLISVVLKTSTTPGDRSKMWWDTRKLFTYGMEQYVPYTLSDLFEAAGTSINTVSIQNAAQDDAQKGLLELRLTQVSDGSYQLRVRSGNEALAEALADFAVRTSITYNPNLSAPIDEGEIVGTLTYDSPNGELITAMLAAERAVAARPEQVSVYEVLPFLEPLEPLFTSGAIWFILAALALLILALVLHRARKRAAVNHRRAAIYNAKRREYERMEAERRREQARAIRENERRKRERAQAAAAGRAAKPGADKPRKGGNSRPNGSRTR